MNMCLDESMLQKSMEGIMKPAKDVDSIQHVVESAPSLPLILNIKLINAKKHTAGRLVFVDLLHPSFIPLVPDPIQDSFYILGRKRLV